MKDEQPNYRRLLVKLGCVGNAMSDGMAADIRVVFRWREIPKVDFSEVLCKAVRQERALHVVYLGRHRGLHQVLLAKTGLCPREDPVSP